VLISQSQVCGALKCASTSNGSCPAPLYTLDVEDPWKYFPDGVPVASLVERGRKQTRPKYTKIYFSKQKKTFTARKDRAHGDIAKTCLLCSCKQDCLMKQGQPLETCLMIQQLRRRLF